MPRRFDALREDSHAIKDFFDRVGPWFSSWFFALTGYRSALKYFWRRHLARMALQEGSKILDSGIGTKNSPMGKLIAATWKNKILDPDYIRSFMLEVGISRVDALPFPWYFKHVDATLMALLAEKA